MQGGSVVTVVSTLVLKLKYRSVALACKVRWMEPFGCRAVSFSFSCRTQTLSTVNVRIVDCFLRLGSGISLNMCIKVLFKWLMAGFRRLTVSVAPELVVTLLALATTIS